MVYVRVMLVWLLPTLGWAAGGQYGFEPISLFPASGTAIFLSASDQGGRGVEFDARGFERSVRLQNRRLGTHFGVGGAPTPAVAFESSGLTLDAVSFVACDSEVILSLAQSWQFRWRTAPEPRAPSFVS